MFIVLEDDKVDTLVYNCADQRKEETGRQEVFKIVLPGLNLLTSSLNHLASPNS